MMISRHRTVVLFVALCMNLQAGSTQAQSTTAHNLSLSNAVQSVDVQGRHVIVMDVKGDLPGSLTLRVTTDASGAVKAGEWALNVSYVEFGPIAPDGDHEESLIQRGVLKGHVTSGSALLDGNGVLVGLSGIQLAVDGATHEFSAVKAGGGSIVASELNATAKSNGSVALTF